MNSVLPYIFYQRPTEVVAYELIGKQLNYVREGKLLTGIITETESYGGSDDPASHAFRGRTPRNSAMFGPAGHAYLYISYGIHTCLNIVAKTTEAPAGAVLIRALLPVSGIELMQQARTTTNTKLLTNGPGKLTQALGITLAENNTDITQSSTLFITEQQTDNLNPSDILKTPRIGISKTTEKLWRFYYHPSFRELL